MVKYIIVIALLFLTNIVFAKDNDTLAEQRLFKKNVIQLKYLTGYYPTFKDKRYISLNKPIK